MIVEQDNYGRSKFNYNITGSNRKTGYFPVFLDPSRDLDFITENTFLYNKPINNEYWDLIKYRYFFQYLRQQNSAYSVQDVKDTYRVSVRKGNITDEKGNTLLLLVCKNIIEIEYSDGVISVEPKDLRLYIAVEFELDPKYKLLYKKTQTEYIRKCFEAGIEVIFVRSAVIEDLFFTHDFELKFDSISELNSILETEPYDIWRRSFEEKEEEAFDFTIAS